MARTARVKRRYKWLGTQDINTITTFGATPTADTTKILPPIVDGDVQAECMVERILVHIQSRRLLTTTIEQYGYIVAKQKFASDGSLIQLLDPLSADVFDLGNTDIMAIGRIPVDPLMNVDTLDVQITKGVFNFEIDIKVRRKINRMTDGIVLTMTTDVAAVMRASIMARVLISYV